jgi:hypothetical protein
MIARGTVVAGRAVAVIARGPVAVITSRRAVPVAVAVVVVSARRATVVVAARRRAMPVFVFVSSRAASPFTVYRAQSQPPTGGERVEYSTRASRTLVAACAGCSVG